MELTKEAIANIRLTCVQNKYYPVKEVDDLLDDISESADRLQNQLQEMTHLSDPEREELERLRKYELYAREEIRQLRERVDLHDRSVYDSSTILRLADQQARDIVERAKMERATVLTDAEQRHARIIAANRSAYYSALQFKQDLHRQFEDLEDQLERAMNALLLADTTQGCIAAGMRDETESAPKEESESSEKGSNLA
jgi:cell division septum initiation protein DivIVA